MFKQIQTFKRQGYSKGEIATVLGMDPKTVAKYCRMDERDILEVYETNEFKRPFMNNSG